MIKRIKNEKVRFYLIYTLLFILCCLGVFYAYYSQGKSLIYNEDGWTQHYKALIYYSRYLKEIVKNIFINKKLVIPQWDFSIGEGAGIIETFHYYAIGDPIAFLSIFVPEEYIYIFYNFSVLLRMYLCGICFSALCFYKKITNKCAILSCSLIYSFCFWNLFNGARHIYFLNPMIYMPLIIIGIEKIINKEKPLLFTLTVCISALSNFYFFYNIVLLTVIYVAVRLLVLYRKNIKQMFNVLLQIFKYSIIGVLMGAVILLPIIVVFLSDTRAGVTFDKHLLYPLEYYLKLPSSFLSSSRYAWLCMGYSSPILLGIFCSIKKFKNNITLFALEIIALVIIIFPIFGQLFNGNTYISNKWCFGLALLLSYVFAYYWDEISNNYIFVSVCLIITTCACLLGGSGLNVNLPLIICALFLGTIVINKYVKYDKTLLINAVLILLVIGDICFIANWFYSDLHTNYSRIATTLEEDANIFVSSEAYTMSNYIDDNDSNDFVRYSGNDLSINSSVLFGKSCTNYFWSLSNVNLSKYRNELQLNEYALYKYNEYDKRSTLYSIDSVKYYVTDNKYSGIIPYGFEYLECVDGYNIYENKYFLPFGFTYDKAISYDDWNKLSVVEKEETLMKAIVLNDTKDSYIPVLYSKQLKYNVDYSNYKNDDNSIVIDNVCDSIYINVDDEMANNIYIEFEGLKFESDEDWKNCENPDKERSNIIIRYNGIEHDLPLYSSNDRMYNARTDFAINLGETANQYSTIEIVFNTTGTYYFDSVSVYNYSYDDYEESIGNLSKEVLENVEFDNNTISGDICVDEDKYLFLSIPYSKGWSATVDGKNVEILNANIGYSAIKLESGHHNVVLKYHTPYLKLGAIISLFGIMIYYIDYALKKRNAIRIDQK